MAVEGTGRTPEEQGEEQSEMIKQPEDWRLQRFSVMELALQKDQPLLETNGELDTGCVCSDAKSLMALLLALTVLCP